MSIIDRMRAYPIGTKRYVDDFNTIEAAIYLEGLKANSLNTHTGELLRAELNIGCDYFVPTLQLKEECTHLAFSKLKLYLYKDIAQLVHEIEYSLVQRDLNRIKGLLAKLKEEIS